MSAANVLGITLTVLPHSSSNGNRYRLKRLLLVNTRLRRPLRGLLLVCPCHRCMTVCRHAVDCLTVLLAIVTLAAFCRSYQGAVFTIRMWVQRLDKHTRVTSNRPEEAARWPPPMIGSSRFRNYGSAKILRPPTRPLAASMLRSLPRM